MVIPTFSFIVPPYVLSIILNWHLNVLSVQFVTKWYNSFENRRYWIALLHVDSKCGNFTSFLLHRIKNSDINSNIMWNAKKFYMMSKTRLKFLQPEIIHSVLGPNQFPYVISAIKKYCWFFKFTIMKDHCHCFNLLFVEHHFSFTHFVQLGTWIVYEQEPENFPCD